MDNELAYDRKLSMNYNDLTPEHRKVLDWVGQNKSVLEVACHTGYFSELLERQGCIVTGVEIFPPALEKAKQFLDRAIVGNIESEEVWQEIEYKYYDVILLMHILEHLVNPEKVLETVKRVLDPNGFIIICLPNISNWEERLDIFRGNFNYTEVGVMDKTHLKFYNYYTAQKLINDSGFTIDDYFGGAWKVKFNFLPNVRPFRRINKVVDQLIHKLSPPNLTDKVLVFKISLKAS